MTDVLYILCCIGSMMYSRITKLVYTYTEKKISIKIAACLFSPPFSLLAPDAACLLTMQKEKKIKSYACDVMQNQRICMYRADFLSFFFFFSFPSFLAELNLCDMVFSFCYGKEHST